ncbi:hypothetical protein N9M50_04300 [Alphaproteobacteria bacterium]|nr:hypothetical protein [Alphaproteobacteria bacterium]
MSKLILVNQTVGPFYISLIKEIVESGMFKNVCLVTGTADPDILQELKGHGVEVMSCVSYKNTNIFLRLTTWSIFSLQIVFHIGRSLLSGQRSDLVWLFSSNPPLLSPLLSLTQLTRFVKYYYFFLDVYPELLISSKVLTSKSILYRIWRFFDIGFVERSHKVFTLDEGMKDKLISLYPNLKNSRKIGVIPLGIGIRNKLKIKREDNFIAHDLGYDERDLVVGYAGNLGLGHDFSFLFSNEIKLGQIKFIFIGGGAQYPKLQEAFSGHHQFQFRPFYPHESLDYVICLPDISIITIDENADSLMIPSKFYSCVAFGVPVLFIGPESHSVARIIRKFNLGFTVKNGDIQQINNVFKQLNTVELSSAYHDNFSAYISSLNKFDFELVF